MKSATVKLFDGIDSLGPFGRVGGWLIRWRAERTGPGNIRLEETLEADPNMPAHGIGETRAQSIVDKEIARSLAGKNWRMIVDALNGIADA